MIDLTKSNGVDFKTTTILSLNDYDPLLELLDAFNDNNDIVSHPKFMWNSLSRFTYF